jgi:hypothetical protein
MSCSALHRVVLVAALTFGLAGHAAAQHGNSHVFGRPASVFSYQAPQYPSPNYQQSWAAQPFADPALKITVTPHAGHAAGARSLRSGSQMVCVRTCDGFFFPVSAGSGADRAVAEFMCKANCPGAPVKVFTKRGDDIENAVGTDRSLYRRLAGALSFRTASSPTCSCRRPTGVITNGPVFDDPTLKAGDVIVVRGRALVFKGGSRPYTERDFSPLEQSSLPTEARQKIASLLTFRAFVPASRTRKASAPIVVAARQAPGTTVQPRVVLPFPLELEQPLPMSANAFAPAN